MKRPEFWSEEMMFHWATHPDTHVPGHIRDLQAYALHLESKLQGQQGTWELREAQNRLQEAQDCITSAHEKHMPEEDLEGMSVLYYALKHTEAVKWHIRAALSTPAAGGEFRPRAVCRAHYRAGEVNPVDGCVECRNAPAAGGREGWLTESQIKDCLAWHEELLQSKETNADKEECQEIIVLCRMALAAPAEEKGEG